MDMAISACPHTYVIPTSCPYGKYGHAHLPPTLYKGIQISCHEFKSKRCNGVLEIRAPRFRERICPSDVRDARLAGRDGFSRRIRNIQDLQLTACLQRKGGAFQLERKQDLCRNMVLYLGLTSFSFKKPE